MSSVIAHMAGAEPVAWMYFDSDGDAIFGHPHGYRPEDAVPVYTHPPARVPLTAAELRNIGKQQDPVVLLHHNVLAFAHAIIAAYEAKNGIGGGK